MDFEDIATEVLNICREKGLTVSTAESCTGGLIGATLTAVSGSSDVVDRGFITYSNQAKHEMLGVSSASLDQYGAVSEVVAQEMSEGGVLKANTGLCVAVTGIAGPTGGTAQKPVGLVYISCAKKNGVTVVEKHVFAGTRDEVRQQTVKRALELLKDQALAP